MEEGNLKPLDVKKFKDIVRQESAKLNLRSFSADGESAFTLALALTAAVKKIYYDKSEMTFSSEPILEKKIVTQFVHRMRVDAMEKFNSITAFSVLKFAANEADLGKQKYLITIVVYLEQKFLPEFLRLLKYPYIDSDDEMEVKDGCGTLINLIAGQYKREMASLGYKDVMMSPFESYINTTADGVGIPNGATEKYELSFEIEGTKRLVVEMVTLAMLPKWSPQEKVAPKKILVIDDDPTFLKTISPFLQSQGFETMVAHDGKEGILLLKENPSLIILDLQMPNMDGYEFILGMKEIAGIKLAPIIILTAKEGLEDIVKVEGIKEYIIKPFQPDALLKSIHRYI